MQYEPSRETQSPPYIPPADTGHPPTSPAAGYPYQQVVVVKGPPTSGWAIASLIFGILGMLAGWCTFAVPCVAAVICGHAGLRDTNGGVKSGRGMAIAGLIMGYLLVVPVVIVLVTGGIGSVFDSTSP